MELICGFCMFNPYGIFYLHACLTQVGKFAFEIHETCIAARFGFYNEHLIKVSVCMIQYFLLMRLHSKYSTICDLSVIIRKKNNAVVLRLVVVFEKKKTTLLHKLKLYYELLFSKQQ